MSKNIWIIVFLLITLAGCSSSAPSWIDRGVKDNNQSFFSTGSGNDVESAKRAALESLSSRLIVNLENETRTTVTKEQNDVYQQYQSDSVFKTESLDFFKVQIEETIKQNNQVHVLISADKQQVFTAIKDKLNTKVGPLLEYSDQGQMFANGLKLDVHYPKYQKYLSVLKAYNQSTFGFEAKLKSFYQEYSNLKTQTSFELAGGNGELQLAPQLKQQLNYRGLNQGKNKHHLKVIIVGPELSYSQNNQYHAYKANGQILYIFDGQVALEEPINIFEYGRDKRQVLSDTKNAIKKLVTAGE